MRRCWWRWKWKLTRTTPKRRPPPLPISPKRRRGKARTSCDTSSETSKASSSWQRTEQDAGSNRAEGVPPSATKMSKARTIQLQSAVTGPAALRAKGGAHGQTGRQISLSAILRTSRLEEMPATADEIIAVVRQSDKQRYELSTHQSQQMLRATQGHSFAVDRNLAQFFWGVAETRVQVCRSSATHRSCVLGKMCPLPSYASDFAYLQPVLVSCMYLHANLLTCLLG